MQKEGYATAVAGKWDPAQEGSRDHFDEWLPSVGTRGPVFMIRSVPQGQTPREEAMDPTFMPISYPPSWKTLTEGSPFFAYFPMALAHIPMT